MRRLTKVQHEVFSALSRSWYERGGQPNLSAVAKGLNMHYVSFKQHLDALHRKGYLRLETQGRGQPPVVHLRHEGVPLVGFIAAGGLVEVEERLEGYFNIPGEPNRFAAQVCGHSMAEKIEHGDVVIFTKSKANYGEICAVRYDNESTLKYIKPQRDGTVLLEPHNTTYEPIIVPKTDIAVEGVYQSLLRGPIIKELFIELN